MLKFNNKREGVAYPPKFVHTEFEVKPGKEEGKKFRVSSQQELDMFNYNEHEGILYAQNFVYGEFEDATVYLDSVNPATGKVLARIPDSNGDVVHRAVLAAKSAFPTWRDLGHAKRAQYLLKAADLLESKLDEMAKMESQDQGKPVSLAKMMDIPRAVLNLRAYAQSWTQLMDSSREMPEAGTICYTTRSPIGVAALIAPWNLPLYLLTFKIAPALMSGNTVVCKPSEMTTVTAWLLAQIFQQVGLPPGVFNLACGLGTKCGEALVRHPDTNIISFTGSTAVGEKIANIAAPMMKKLSLELGGKNAAIVFKDANLEKALPVLLRAAFLNQGEICLCTSRIFVHEDIYDTFVDRFVQGARKLVVGDPSDPDTFMGAINSRAHLDKILRYVGYAQEDGGRVLCGESVSPALKLPNALKEGYFCQPTVIVGLNDEARCMQDEIFGPVVCISPFRTEEEVISRANNVRYGLCASVWSENVGVIHRVSQKMQVGTVWANCWLIRDLNLPFGGVKHSGTGREGLIHSLEAFTEEKAVCVKIQ